MFNVYAPRMLKDSEKERRVRDSKSFLKHYEKDCAQSMKHSGGPIEHYRLNQNNPYTAASTLVELDVLEFGRVFILPGSSTI